jgi:short-subunit dehydrogenase
MEIKSSQVMITGANRGIGRAFAKTCAEAKAHLHLVVRKKDPELIKEMEAAGAASVTMWTVDLSLPDSVESLIQQTQHLHLDILFNNAGMLTGGLLEEQKTAEINQMLQVNVNALIRLTQAHLPGMLKRKRGKIINNSSVVAIMHVPCASTYAASKAAVLAFTECLRIELKDTGVSTLLLITPGIKTRFLEDVVARYGKYIQMKFDYSIPPQKYAEMIKEAVLNDLPIIEPSGLTGIGLQVAKHLPQVFGWGVKSRFRRG